MSHRRVPIRVGRMKVEVPALAHVDGDADSDRDDGVGVHDDDGPRAAS